jgi:predicted N-acetyltransferase YhbS
MSTATSDIVAESPEHLAAIEDLLDTAFGPGRYAKTAYRLREGTRPIPELSFVALRDGEVIGSVRFSAITLGGAPALLLGPLAIHPDHKNRGHGLALMRAGLERAKAAGHRLVVLVGDEPYYARAGFARLPAGRVQLPGPVDPARLLGLELVPGALEGVGGLARPASR